MRQFFQRYISEIIHEDLFSSFYANLLTDMQKNRQRDRQTDRQTDTWFNLTSSVEVTKVATSWPLSAFECTLNGHIIL